MEEKRKCVQWIKEHKKELIFAGLSTGAVIAIMLGIKNKETFDRKMNLKHFLSDSSDNSLNIIIKDDLISDSFADDSVLIEVSPHIRNLHEGWSASPNKIETALENGFALKDGQTWVESYKKECLVA